MRLKNIESGQKLSKKLILALMGLKHGERPQDVLCTMWYSTGFLGNPT